MPPVGHRRSGHRRPYQPPFRIRLRIRKDSPRAQATRAFVREFSRLHAIPLAFWDERMSTAAVERDLIANDVSRAKRAAVIDKMAAAYILQGALDRLTRR